MRGFLDIRRTVGASWLSPTSRTGFLEIRTTAHALVSRHHVRAADPRGCSPLGSAYGMVHGGKTKMARSKSRQAFGHSGRDSGATGRPET